MSPAAAAVGGAFNLSRLYFYCFHFDSRKREREREGEGNKVSHLLWNGEKGFLPYSLS